MAAAQSIKRNTRRCFPHPHLRKYLLIPCLRRWSLGLWRLISLGLNLRLRCLQNVSPSTDAREVRVSGSRFSDPSGVRAREVAYPWTKIRALIPDLIADHRNKVVRIQAWAEENYCSHPDRHDQCRQATSSYLKMLHKEFVGIQPVWHEKSCAFTKRRSRECFA